MPPAAGFWTSILHVADVRRSIDFYRLLGFELVDVDAESAPACWARLHCEGGAIMLFVWGEGAEAEEAFGSRPPAGSYMYTPDLPALRAHLLANGAKVSEIHYPHYMPSGELRVEDPDGYVVFVGHWSDTEHQAWLKRLEEKKRAGTLRP